MNKNLRETRAKRYVYSAVNGAEAWVIRRMDEKRSVFAEVQAGLRDPADQQFLWLP